jgi:DNA sulfur modification protein DndD
MIIREIEFHNFLRFYGTSKLQLISQKSAASSLTLILAPNDSGKTSLIRALEFLFYGTVDGKRGEHTIAALVNDEAVRKSGDRSSEGYVQATLVSKGTELTVRRTVSVGGSGKADRRVKTVALQWLDESQHKKEWKADHNQVIQYKLDRLVPDSLFQYFFFQGEGLADTLIEKQDPKIREGLTELLHEDDWKEAIADAHELLGTLNAECQRASGQNRELKDALERLAIAEENLTKVQKDLERQETFLENAKGEVERLTSEIAESVGKVDRESAQKLQKVKLQLEQHRGRLSGGRSGLASSIGNTRGLPFLKKAFEPVRAMLEDLREQNLLPADVSEGFIGRILKREKCICACELKTGSAARKNVEQFRASSLTAELNADLFQLYNLLEQGSARGFEPEIDQALKAIRTSAEFIDSEEKAIAKLEQELKALEGRVDEAAHQRCEGLLLEQHKAIDQHMSQKLRVREAQIKIDSAKKYKDLTKKEVNKLRSETKIRGTDSAFAKREILSELVDALEDGLSRLKHSLHDPLAKTLSELYDPVVKDGSEARIAATTLLPYIEKDGKRATFLGGGQKQVLCLAYIIALSQLRKTLHAALRKAGVMVSATDDQSFVMDSIFGQCEPEYQEAICRFLPGQAGQILLLLAGQQWTPTVQRELSKEIDQLFGFEYHSPNTRYDESKHQFSVGKNVYKLLKRAPDGATAFTVIKKLSN